MDPAKSYTQLVLRHRSSCKFDHHCCSLKLAVFHDLTEVKSINSLIESEAKALSLTHSLKPGAGETEKVYSCVIII